jgi:hypothetical protein
MTNIKRLDRLIVRLVFVRNLLTKHEHEIDFDIDLHSAEAEVNSLYESALTQSEDISDDNPRD